MGKITGFLEIARRDRSHASAADRVRHSQEFAIPLSEEATREQAARCMDCGIPYCHQGCPVNNRIPDWNDLVWRSDWRKAAEDLHNTNNFPEITGRICPAPCEAACTLNLENEPVTIKTIECAIADKALNNGWTTPQPPTQTTGKKVAIIGSGPAGLACAQQLARAGHAVEVFEKNERPGGLLTFGIPDFKLEKSHIARRVAQMEAEGVRFRCGAHIGRDIPIARLHKTFDALVLAGGAETPRDLPIDGRAYDGIHFAMDYLTQQNRRLRGDIVGEDDAILATGKHVVVIGGGDTGSDCIGTAFRQGALSVTQLEIMPRPPEEEDKTRFWPDWPLRLRTSTSHEEGAQREWSALTSRFEGSDGHITRLVGAKLGDDMKPVLGGEFALDANLALLAMGFTAPVREGMLDDLGVVLNDRGAVLANEDDYTTSEANVFACGDMRRGQSLVVWAIREGRQCARAIDAHLMGATSLPR